MADSRVPSEQVQLPCQNDVLYTTSRPDASARGLRLSFGHRNWKRAFACRAAFCQNDRQDHAAARRSTGGGPPVAHTRRPCCRPRLLGVVRPSGKKDRGGKERACGKVASLAGPHVAKTPGSSTGSSCQWHLRVSTRKSWAQVSDNEPNGKNNHAERSRGCCGSRVKLGKMAGAGEESAGYFSQITLRGAAKIQPGLKLLTCRRRTSVGR